MSNRGGPNDDGTSGYNEVSLSKRKKEHFKIEQNNFSGTV